MAPSDTDLEQLPRWAGQTTIDTVRDTLAAPLDAYSYFYFPFCLSSAVIALLLLRWQWGRWPRLAELLPRSILLHPSARLDYLVYLINPVIYALLLGPLVLLGVVGCQRRFCRSMPV